MTGGALLVAALLLAAAVLVAWPVRSIRARRRRVLAPKVAENVGADPDEALVEWIRGLGRGLDAPPDGLGSLPSSGHQPPVAPSFGGGRTLVGWSTRGVNVGQPWPRVAGGSVGSTRPAGPARPPTRRDPRGPAGTAGPVAIAPDAERRAAMPVSARVIEADVLDRADASGVATADGRGDVDSGGNGAVDPMIPTAGGPRGARATDSSVRAPRSSVRLLLVGLVGAGVGAAVAGPVAAVAVGGYGTLAMRALLRWRANRHAERIRRRGLDQLCGLAADLRAGLPVPPAIEIPTVSGPDGLDRLAQLTSAAVRLADRTGAPLAELVERIEADARATDRGLSAAAAQAAGARATAWLLAALPIGGIGLGYGIGVDPVAVLLHSTVGGVCAVLAVVLQVIGLLWAERLGATPGRAG
ncbi:tight adherence protein B [Micromonospora coriariae]|uniref:Tight adherence protein B n=1 Tax=Micromonospora coriariae TaxID=285665 RepID=A0A1C4VHS0_9ACTN|nr:tight adherence protein B [Micromonospora coriariae]